MKINGWSVVPTGVGIAMKPEGKECEICLSYVAGHYVINVYRDGVDLPVRQISFMESEVESTEQTI